jgi:hypothetical protein
MEIYNHINDILAGILRVFSDGLWLRWAHEGSARVSNFWQTSPLVDTGISFAQIIAALVSAVFVFVIAISLLGKKALKKPQVGESNPTGGEANASAEAVSGGALRERWNEIRGHLDSPREGDWKLAVIEADKLVDDALARVGFSGATFGDRLTNIQPGALLSLDGLWWAHKVRNRLAHEVDYFLRYTEARQAVAYYEQTLSELQLI